MATSSLYTQQERAQIALLPTTTDPGARPLVSPTQFGPFPEGASLVVASTASFHIVAGDASAAASTSSPRFAAGVYKFGLPDGCTYVSMIDSSAGAGVGQAYQG